MKTIVTLTFLVCLLGLPAYSANKYFDGATGTIWDTGSTADWGAVSGGPYNTTWASYDDAFFEGTGATLTLNNPFANRLNFTSSGYVLNGTTLNMGDPGGINNFNVTGANTATINSNISQPYGTAIQKIGTGTLVLGGTVSSTAGNNRIEAGTLRLATGANMTGNVWIADSGGTTATMEINGGTLTSNGQSTVATRGNGTLTVNSGTANFNGGLYMGYQGVGGVGTSAVNLNGGALTVGGQFVLGQDDNAGAVSTFTQTGGDFTYNGPNVLYAGNFGAATTLSVSGGTFTAIGSDLRLGVRGAAASNIVNISGTGAMDINGSFIFGHGSTSGSGGVLNLNGGTLEANGFVEQGSHSSTINFNGGTLKAGAANGNFIVVDAANIQAGGAIFDTNGNNITVGQALPGAGALTKSGTGTLTLTNNNGYIGSTTINGGTLLLNNPSAGAYTYAGGPIAINNGATLQISGTGSNNQYWFNNKQFTFDSSGGGTIDTTATGLNFVVYGGTTFTTTGGSQNNITGSAGLNLHNGDIANFVVADGPNASDLTVSARLWNGGGVNKTGAGTMTLSATNNSYTGATTVNGGRLILNAGSSSTSFTIAAGTVLELNTSGGNIDYGSTTFSGAGTLQKTGANQAQWPGSAATFALAPGSLIDIQGGSFIGGSSANENWVNNHSDLNIASGAVFNGVEANVRVNALTGAGSLLTGYAGAGYSTFTIGVDGGNGTFSGVIGNSNSSGKLTKIGVGTQILTGANTYTGGTVISGGTLQIGDGGTTGSLSDTGGITDNSALIFDRSNAYTYGGSISGSGTVTKNGAGVLTLAASTTYGGATTVNGGTLALQGAFNSSSFSIASGAVLELDTSSGNRDYNSTTFSGAGTLRKTGANQAQWPATTAVFALAPGSLIDVQGGSFVGGSFGNENWTNNHSDLTIATGAVFNGVEANVRVNALNGNGTLQTGYTGAGYSTFTIGVDGGGGTFSGVIADSTNTGNLTKVGAGTQILSGNNTYSGGTTISAGTLQIGDGVAASGTLGTGNASIAGGATLLFSRTGSLTIANSFSGAGTLEYQSTGASAQGHYDPSGNNSGFTGNTIIDKARVVYNNQNEMGATTAPVGVLDGGQIYAVGGTYANPLTLAGSGWLEPAGQLGAIRLDSGAQINGAITLADDATIMSYENGNGSVNGTVAVGSHTLTLHNRNGTFGLNAVFSGTGIVRYEGTGASLYGQFDPNGNSSAFNGSVEIDRARVRIDNQNNLGDADTQVTVMDGGQLWALGNLTSPVSIAGLGWLEGAGQLGAIRLNADISGDVTLTADSRIASYGGANGTLSGTVLPSGHDLNLWTQDANISINGNVVGTGSITKIGNYSLFLGGDNSGFAGTVNHTSSNLFFSSATAGSPDTAWVLTGSPNLFQNDSGGAVQLGSLSGNAGDVTGGGGSSFTIGALDTNTTYSGTVSGAMSLTKVGDGTLTLSGNNSYSGGTTVAPSAGGMLEAVVNTAQNALGSGATTVGAGSILRLNNTTTSGDTTINNVFSGAGELNIQFANGGAARNTIIPNIAGMTGTITLTTAGGATADKLRLNNNVTTAAALVINNNTQLFSPGNTNNFNGGITVQGTGNSENRGAIRLGGTVGGTITLAGNTTVGTEGGTLTGNITSAGGDWTLTLGTSNSNGNATLSGTISDGTGTIALTKDFAGTATLLGTSTYSGATTINGGTLQLGNGTTTGSINNSSGIAVGTASTLAFNPAAGSHGIAPAVTGTGIVAQNSAGATVTLANAGGFAGEYQVNAGTLAVTNAAMGTPNSIFIAGGAQFNTLTTQFAPTAPVTVSGTGNLETGGAGVAWNSNLTMSPGNSPGQLNVAGNVDWSGAVGAGGTYDWQVYDANTGAGTGYDLINITGSLDMTGGSGTINGIGLSGIGPDVAGLPLNVDMEPGAQTLFEIIRTSAGVIGFGSFSPTFVNNMNHKGFFKLLLGNGGNSVYLLWEATPEPGTWVLFGLLAAAGVVTIRRRKLVNV